LLQRLARWQVGLLDDPDDLASLIHEGAVKRRSALVPALAAKRGQAPSPEFFTALGSMGFSGLKDWVRGFGGTAAPAMSALA